jgi:hypothetical protein
VNDKESESLRRRLDYNADRGFTTTVTSREARYLVTILADREALIEVAGDHGAPE